MALNVEQHASGEQASGGATTIAVSWASGAPASGRLMRASVGARGGTATNPSGWTTAREEFNGTETDLIRSIYKVSAGSEPSSVTVTGLVAHTGAGTSGTSLDIYEVSGADTSSPLDKVASTARTAGVTSLSSGTTATLSQADEICFASFFHRANVTFSSFSNSYTLQENRQYTDGGATGRLITGTRIVSATTAQSTTETWTTSDTAMGLIDTYKMAAGGTTFTSKLGGTISSSSAIAKLAQLAKAGSSPAAGAVAKTAAAAKAGALASTGAGTKAVSISRSGSCAPTGAPSKLASKPTAGSIALSGAVAMMKVVLLALVGAIGSSGAAGRLAQKAVAGAIPPTGTLARLIGKLTGGALAVGGVIGKLIARLLGGTIAAAGAESHGMAGLIEIGPHPHRLAARGTHTTLSARGTHTTLSARGTHTGLAPR